MNLAKSSLKIFAARVSKSLASFIAVIIFSRELGASPLGTYYPFVALLGILAIPADFGIGSAAQKRISEGEDASEYLGSAIALKLPILFVVSLLTIIGQKYVNQFLGAPLALPLVATLLISQAAHLAIGVLRGELRVGETAIIEVLQPLGWLLIGYIFYARGYGVSALIYGHLAGSILMFIVGWWKVSTPISWPTMEHSRSLFDYGRYSVIASVGGYLYSWMDTAIITLFVVTGTVATRADIGAYENAWRLSLVVMMLTQAVSTSLFPQISQWNVQDATDRIESVLPTALLPGILLVIPAVSGTIVLSKELLTILFGPEFTVAWLVLIVLSGEKLFQSIHSVLGSVLQGIDRPDLDAYSTMASAAINLILNVTLIWEFGIIGAAVATTVASAVLMIFQIYYVRNYIKIDFPVREAIWSVVSSTVMGICVYGIQTIYNINNTFDLGLIVVFGGIIYSTIAFIYQPIRETTQETLRPVIASLV